LGTKGKKGQKSRSGGGLMTGGKDRISHLNATKRYPWRRNIREPYTPSWQTTIKSLFCWNEKRRAEKKRDRITNESPGRKHGINARHEQGFRKRARKIPKWTKGTISRRVKRPCQNQTQATNHKPGKQKKAKGTQTQRRR